MSLMVTRMGRAPDGVIYDFGCAAQEYCLNTEPEYFKYTQFCLDHLHKYCVM